MNRIKTSNLALIAMFSAMVVVFSQIVIVIPLTPIPLNLATAAVMLSGLFLKGYNGAISMVVYVLLGAIGLPVFSSFSGGIGVVLGPTGGYIMGYILMSLTIGLIIKKKDNFAFSLVSMVVGTVICYIAGSIWFMILTKSNLVSTLMLCVVPFVFGDIFKIAVCGLIYKKMSVFLRSRKV